MNAKIIIGSAVGFILGAVGGIFGGYYYSKNKYLEMAEKEIASVKKVYEKHFNQKENNKEVPSSKKPIIAPLTETTDQDNYKKYAGMYKDTDGSPKIGTVHSSIPSNKQPKSPVKVPYIITPEEYRDSDYESETLIWYSDKILADADGNVIHNINEVVGPEALSTFGRYLDDTVYVRDDNKKLDYEIIWDSRKFSSVSKLAGDATLSEDDVR